jgi:hypothetical protein
MISTAENAVVPKEKRKMRPGGGKGKGNGFEGTVAKTLTKALAPLNFIRTPGSGARVGGRNFETIGKMFGEDALKIFVGDVVPVNEKQEGLRFGYSIECKFYATQDPFTALVSNTANIFKWFQEAVDDALKVDKSPMLIFKWNHTPIFVAIDTMESKADYTVLTNRGIKPRLTLLTYGSGRSSIDIYYLNDLLPVKEFWYSKT